MQAPARARPDRARPPSAVDSLTQALAAPFDASEVRFKPAVVSGNRALALAYVDARVIQDRLDDVLGVDGWQDNYECLPDGSVVCRLQLRLGDDWITKVDVGGPSEQPDGGDRMKAAFSDALKRAAVKFGIGRYLYRLPSQWLDYDAQRRQFARTPTLPAWALPAKETSTAPTPARPAAARKPLTGLELQRRLQDYDARLAAQGLCQPGELVDYVCQAGVTAGFGTNLAVWTEAAVALAVQETKAFETQARRRAEQQKDVA